jgi:hypothetical protein
VHVCWHAGGHVVLWVLMIMLYCGWDVPTGGLPRLAWCSLGSNPAAAGVPALPDLPRVLVSELSLGKKLGQGASGEVFNGEQGPATYIRTAH